MPWEKGFAFFTPERVHGGRHLYGVFSHEFEGSVFIANVTTLRRHSDRSCLVEAGEHPKVSHPSCIYYAGSRIVPVAKMRALGQLIPAPPFSEALIGRVVQGALHSDETPPNVKAFLRAQAARG